MEEAYQSIDWRAVFLIAAMLPAWDCHGDDGRRRVPGRVRDRIRWAPMVRRHPGRTDAAFDGATQVMPSAGGGGADVAHRAVHGGNMGVSPYPFMMGIAYALAAAFLSPVAHPANVLVMSPGGYRFSDYFKQGLPIVLIVILVSVPLLPVLFPF
jgi:hypothetical protein